MSLHDDFQSIIEQAEKGFKEVAQSLQNEVVGESPVDTGRFKQAWAIEEYDPHQFTFEMFNNVEYSEKLWAGGKSKQGWGVLGGYPILKKHENMLQRKFEEINIK